MWQMDEKRKRSKANHLSSYIFRLHVILPRAKNFLVKKIYSIIYRENRKFQ